MLTNKQWNSLLLTRAFNLQAKLNIFFCNFLTNSTFFSSIPHNYANLLRRTEIEIDFVMEVNSLSEWRLTIRETCQKSQQREKESKRWKIFRFLRKKNPHRFMMRRRAEDISQFYYIESFTLLLNHFKSTSSSERERKLFQSYEFFIDSF